MKFGKLVCLLGLIVTMSGLCRAELLPGDFALTRIQGSVVSLVALKQIPAGEKFRITDSNWVNGSFDGSGNGGVFTVPGNLQTGDQQLIDLANIGINLDWGKTLHFFQSLNHSITGDAFIRHLLVVELRRDGLRWISDIPNGLIRDVTHIVIREQFEGQGMDHIIKAGLLPAKLTPYKWMRALGSFRAWTHIGDVGDYPDPPSLSQWLELSLTVNPSPGIISLPYVAQNYPGTASEIYVPVRRSFGSGGDALATLKAIDKFGPFKRWRNETISDFNMDFTDVAFGPGVGFVAVSPNSGLLFINQAGSWEAKETNGSAGLNLELSGITHDGDGFWASSLKGGIYKSGDGINWDVVREGQEGEQLFGIQFNNGVAFRYCAFGANGLALFSQDGAEWTPAEFANNENLYGSTFFDGLYVLCGAKGTVLYTNDPTKSWANASIPNGPNLYGATQILAGTTPTLLIVGQHGTMMSTPDLQEAGFTPRQSNTSQSLFDVVQVLRNGGEDKYVFAVGANGATVVSYNGSEFQTPRFDPRAPALYALAQDPNEGGEPIVYGVGEYGSLTRYDTDGATLSGSISGLNLDGNGASVNVGWEAGVSGEQYIKLTKEGLNDFRERILLNLERPENPLSNYRLGNDESEINFFRSININGGADTITPVAQNYGPLLNLTGAQLEVLNEEEWRLRFRIINTSRLPSKRLFIRFEGTNLPDFDIPPGDTAGPGSTLKELEHTDFIEAVLRQPVETIALYEEFRSGEVVLKARTAINSLAANPNWVPNGIFERSLGAYLLDNTGLNDPGIPGIGILGGGGGQGAAAESPAAQPAMKMAAGPVTAGGSGFVFSGSAPTPPDNNPEAAELVLLSVDIGGPIGMDVRETYDFFLVGSFYNTGTGLTEDYTMNTVDWDVTESSLPAEGLSIQDDAGTFDADPHPGVTYPRAVSIDAATTEGAPMGEGDEPVEYSDSQGLNITEPSSYTTYAEWVTANSLAGDNALQTADPDGDNIINLIEFILGTDPNAGNAMNGVTSSHDPDTGIFEYCVTLPNDLSAVTVKVETSTDLSTWTERPMTLQSSNGSSDTWCISLNLGAAGFARLKVETYTP